MARNHPIKILWYGSETDAEGNPIIPKISPSFEKRLEGLNEGEIYIHNDDKNPSIYIRTNKDRVVAISGSANIEEFSKYFLRKDKEDTANGLITFLKGLLIGKNGSGITVLENGMSQAVVDYLYVKVKAVFDELEVKKKTYVGGEQVISHAGMKCNRVEELDDVYRCYFKEEEDGIEIENQFTPGSLAIAQECNIKTGVSHHVGNRYYWRLVTAVGENYIDLSKTVCDPNVENDVPVAGDDIVGLGHKTDITRQAAIILSSVNEVSPSIIMYQGINDFTLTGKDVISFDFDKSTGKARMKVYGDTYIGDKDRTTYMEYTQDKGVDIKGMFHIEQGSTGWRNMEGLPDEIQAAADLAQEAKDAIDNAAVGSVNLLRNSGFTGDYETEDLSAATELSADTELFSKQLEYWTGVATVSADSDAGSGYSAAIGSLSQSVSLIKGESYVISYKAKGTSVSVSCGSFSVSQPLTSSYQRYTHKITFNGSGIFLISGTATVCDLQLERGTIATDWKPSILDNDKATAGFQSINYIASAIKDGSVDILGGLILANMIQLGNYKNGKLQKVTAGVSGIYNDDDDVAFWAGGKLEQAILTVMRFRNDPNYQPTDAEWANMANFVATHGGDVFLRGYIYALGGYFRGKVEIANGKILLNEDGSGQLANGNIKWDADGNPEFVGKVKVSSPSGYEITIFPEDEYGRPSIDIHDDDGNSLLDISLQYGLNGMVPRIFMNDPSNSDVLYFRPDSMVVEQKGSDGYIYQTQIMGGRIIMVKGSEIVWDQNMLPK
nr:MAG TPA: tail protein [Bacteriophage sp.]